MKKFLLGTTIIAALAAGSVANAAAPATGTPVPTPPADGGTFADSGKALPKNKSMKLTIGGTLQPQAYVESQDLERADSDERDHNFIVFSLVEVKAYGEADHIKMNYEARVRLKAGGALFSPAVDVNEDNVLDSIPFFTPAVTADRADVALFHDSWGRFVFGDTNGVLVDFQRQAYTLLPYGGTGSTALSQEILLGFGSNEPLLVPFSDTAGTKITYRTPSFHGFRIGADYTVDTNHFGTQPIDDDVEGFSLGNENQWSVLLNYKNTFENKFGVDIVVGYQQGYAEDDAVEDRQVLHTSAAFDYQGFTLAGGYTDLFKTGVVVSEGIGTFPLPTESDNEDGGWGFDVGLKYATGPWKFAAIYNRTEKTVDDVLVSGLDGNGDAKLYNITGGITYTLAPGLSLNGELTYGEIENDESRGAARAGTDGYTDRFNNEIWFGILGVTVDF